MSFTDLPYDKKRDRITTAMQKIAAIEIRAIQKTPWLDAATRQHDIDKTKAAYQLLIKIFAELENPPATPNPHLDKAWQRDRHLTANYIALILRTTRAKDLRLAKLAKILGGLPRLRASLETVAKTSASEAEIEATAQQIIGNTNQAIGFLEFTADNPQYLTELASSVWNKTANKLAQKLFGKTLSRLTAAQSLGMAEKLAPLLQKVPGVEKATLAWLKSKGGLKFGEARAEFLGYNLFADIDSISEREIVKVWLEPRMVAFAGKLGELVGPATIFLDMVTVVLDTVDEVDRWSGAFVRSATTAYAAGATGVLLGASLTDVGLGASAAGAVTAEMTVVEAALVSMTSALSSSAGAALASSPALPVAAFCLVTGVVVAVGIGVAALIETLVDAFFGPEHIPAGLRANYAMPVSAAHMSSLSAEISAG
jgi:hypothetical protein